VIFSRLRTLNRLRRIRLRHSLTPGIPLGRYESGLEAVWAWRERAHLLVVERYDYGAGENLVARCFRTYDGPKVLLWPKGECGWRKSTDNECFSLLGALDKLFALNSLAAARAIRIEDGEDVPDMLVAIPELHDMTDQKVLVPEDQQFVNDLTHLLKVGRAARIHVMANTRQHVIYPAYLPVEMRNQFSGLLVLGKTGDAVTRQLGLPHPFDRPHGWLGDLEDGFWSLEVRTR
jgi:hypothetical protein